MNIFFDNSVANPTVHKQVGLIKAGANPRIDWPKTNHELNNRNLASLQFVAVPNPATFIFQAFISIPFPTHIG